MKTDITPALAPRRETIITTIYLYTYTKYVQYYIHQVLISIDKIQIHLKYVGRETLESKVLRIHTHPLSGNFQQLS